MLYMVTFTINTSNVSIYTIHGSYGISVSTFSWLPECPLGFHQKHSLLMSWAMSWVSEKNVMSHHVSAIDDELSTRVTLW